jgi:hypothetical protein
VPSGEVFDEGFWPVVEAIAAAQGQPVVLTVADDDSVGQLETCPDLRRGVRAAFSGCAGQECCSGGRKLNRASRLVSASSRARQGEGSTSTNLVPLSAHLL